MSKQEMPQRLQNELAENNVGNELFTTVKHSVNIGDLYACMGAIKKFYEVTSRKVKVLQQINMPGSYYPGAVHPTTHEGVAVTMNQSMFDMCKPLVEGQEYIHSIESYTGQTVDIDFDVIRGKTFVNLPHGAIQGWVPLAFPDLAFDISKQWIFEKGECPESVYNQVKGKIIINFTERYRNALIDYFFLKNYASDLIFSGTEREHWLFCNKWQLAIPRLEINNFMELAHALKTARFLLGNQSQMWNLAEAMKTPRILELCQYAQNCVFGIGENSYGFFHQAGVEYYFRFLYGKTLKSP